MSESVPASAAVELRDPRTSPRVGDVVDLGDRLLHVTSIRLNDGESTRVICWRESFPRSGWPTVVGGTKSGNLFYWRRMCWDDSWKAAVDSGLIVPAKTEGTAP